MQILVELDGVMRTTDDKIIATGILLYSTLTAYNRMTIMTSMSKPEVERWLATNKIVDFDLVIDSSVYLEDEDPHTRQIDVARSRGPVDLFITANPNNWVYAFEQGISCVMFGVPAYLRPEFRPDGPKKLRSWDKITEAIDAQNEKRTKDVRLRNTEKSMFE